MDKQLLINFRNTLDDIYNNLYKKGPEIAQTYFNEKMMNHLSSRLNMNMEMDDKFFDNLIAMVTSGGLLHTSIAFINLFILDEGLVKIYELSSHSEEELINSYKNDLSINLIYNSIIETILFILYYIEMNSNNIQIFNDKEIIKNYQKFYLCILQNSKINNDYFTFFQKNFYKIYKRRRKEYNQDINYSIKKANINIFSLIFKSNINNEELHLNDYFLENNIALDKLKQQCKKSVDARYLAYNYMLQEISTFLKK